LQDLASKVVEVLPILSLSIQRDVISALPEIVLDSEHTDIALALNNLMTDTVELTAPVIDALTNLNVDSKMINEIRESVLKILPSARLEDLPVAVRFIQQSINPTNAQEVINELREKLNFRSVMLPTAASTPVGSAVAGQVLANFSSSEQMSEFQTVEMIRSGIRFQKCVTDAWMKVIESVESPADHKAIDIIVLLALHLSTGRRKAVESQFRIKIKSGALSEELVATTFSSHSQILREYFPSILVLSDVLLRSSDLSVVSFASTLYCHAFTSFTGYYQQEVVGSLVTHIGSGYASEIDAALDVLTNLVETCSPAMAPYAVFLKGILDYLDALSLPQIRKLFSMLSWLTSESPGNAGMIQDEMHIIIRKQLSSTNMKYKRIGIIGAVMIVKGLAQLRSVPSHLIAAESQAVSNTSSRLSADAYKQVISLLELVKRCSSQHPEIAALFYDELANVMCSSGGLDHKVQSWINDSVVADFQDSFLVDTEVDLPSEPLPLRLAHGLDDGGEVVLNLMPMLQLEASHDKTRTEKSETVTSNVICIGPQFRLLQVCEACQNNGSLDGVDALLGCSIVLCKEEVFGRFETLSPEHQQLVCSSLFHTLNWFIEVINAFSTQDNTDVRGKLLVRLKSINELRSQLCRCLAVTRGFSPPIVHFDADSVFEASATGSVQTDKHSKKSGKRGRPRKKASNDKGGTVDSNETVDKDKDVSTSEASVSLDQWQDHFRELDMSVLKILTYLDIARKAIDSECHTKEVTVLQLGHAELQFLLQDLKLKLAFSLKKKGVRPGVKGRRQSKVGFSHLSAYRPQQVVVKVVELFPVLCDHLEKTATYFQDVIAENDNIVDCLVDDQEKWNIMCSCYQLILEIFQALLSWSGFNSVENRPILEQILTCLSVRGPSCSAARIKSGSIQEMSRLSFAYLEQFSSSIPRLSVAVSLTHLLAALVDFSQTAELKPLLGTMACTVLKREWPEIEREKGNKLNEWLLPLVRYHISFTENPVAVIEAICEGFPQLIEEDALASKLYPTLTRATSGSFYKAASEELVKSMKVDGANKKIVPIEIPPDRIHELDIIVRVFHILISIVKSFDTKGILSCALKLGRSFLETFVRFGMPVLEKGFKTNKDDIQALLKNLQQSTRCLQHFCGHSKVVKDVQLVNHVPALKRSLEAFVFHVKAMLAFHNCQEAFWLGNLKNRNLQGDEIASQSQVSVATSEGLSQPDVNDGPEPLGNGEEDSEGDHEEDGEEDGEEDQEEDGTGDGFDLSHVV
jgi:Fanconi anemia group D2 protein